MVYLQTSNHSVSSPPSVNVPQPAAIDRVTETGKRQLQALEETAPVKKAFTAHVISSYPSTAPSVALKT